LTYTTAPLDTDRGFAAVLGLQGRLTLESDANENVAILAHFLRTLVIDLVGPGAGPARDPGFEITPQLGPAGVTNLQIGGGHYYGGGLLARTSQVGYLEQPNHHDTAEHLHKLLEAPVIAYLKVWERLITAVEDPSIREVALGSAGPDTAARSKVVWQVLLAPDPDPTADAPETPAAAMKRWDALAQTTLSTPPSRSKTSRRSSGRAITAPWSSRSCIARARR
jgi:hypothetical protein